MMTFKKFIIENVDKPVTISAPGYHNPNHYTFHKVTPAALHSAHQASLSAIKMLGITHSQKEKGVERMPVPSRKGKSYEQIEANSHHKLVGKIQKLAKKHGVKLKDSLPSHVQNFIHCSDHMIKQHNKKHWDSNLYQHCK
jgi:hypothetical protein